MIPHSKISKSIIATGRVFERDVTKTHCCNFIQIDLIFQRGGRVCLLAVFLLLLNVSSAHLLAQQRSANSPDTSVDSNQARGGSRQELARESFVEFSSGQASSRIGATAADTILSDHTNHLAEEIVVEKKLADRKRLELEYAAGMAAMQLGHWTHAVLVFERILENEANFRDARAQLNLAENALERESADSVLADYYAEALYAMDHIDLGMARRALQKIHALNPDYRDVAEYLREIETTLQWNSSAAPAQIVLKMTVSLRDSLNRDVIEALRQENWARATTSFEKLKIMQPGYRNVGDLLQEQWENMHGSAQQHTAVLSSRYDEVWPYLGGACAAFTVLAIFSVAGSAPTVRARYFLWRGNFDRAAKIYERILERDPTRLRCFLPLAQIYLGLGKEDERAVRLYKIVLQLNLVTHQREAMNAIIAQSYVGQKQTDGDGIEFLEQALETELRKRSRLLPAGEGA